MSAPLLRIPFAVFLSRSLHALGLATLALVAACSDLPTDATGSNESTPPPTRSVNPMAGAAFYVDPGSNARRQIEAWKQSRPADAAQLEKIATQPVATWVGDWTPGPFASVDELVTRITTRGAVPVLVLYNIPHRDCGQYSAGGAASAAAYRSWVAEVARGIGARRAVVVLEPDALAGMDCLPRSEQEQRVQLIREAVQTLKRGAATTVYVDGGNARWQPAQVMADRLLRGGLAAADGFALNVSNFYSTEESIAFGEALSARTGGKHFVVDTSRNGLGPSTPYTWCNPRGRALGTRPTVHTGHPLVDALLWIKAPGESDGECNGGPSAGRWWPEYALELARNG